MSPASGPEFLLRVPCVVQPTSLIFEYVQSGNLQGIKNLYTDGLASPYDVCGVQGYTLLHFAINLEGDRTDVMRFLINTGSDVNMLAGQHSTAVDMFISKMLSRCYDENTAKSLTELFNMDACEDSLSRRRFSRLHAVILGLAHGDLSLELQTLDGLQALNSTDVDGSTSLMWAARTGNLAAVNTLLLYGADVSIQNSFHNTAIFYAIMSSAATAPMVLRRLLEAGCSPNEQQFCTGYPLHMSVIYRDDPENFIQPLLEYGADVPLGKDGLFALAIRMNRVKTVAFLLETRVWLLESAQDQIAHLQHAIRHNNHEVLKLLVDYGAEIGAVSRDGTTFLHSAATIADCQTLEILAAYAPNVNPGIKDSTGRTAAQIFASRNGKDAVLVESFDSLLKSVKANKSQSMISGKTNMKVGIAIQIHTELRDGEDESDSESFFEANEY